MYTDKYQKKDLKSNVTTQAFIEYLLSGTIFSGRDKKDSKGSNELITLLTNMRE